MKHTKHALRRHFSIWPLLFWAALFGLALLIEFPGKPDQPKERYNHVD